MATNVINSGSSLQFVAMKLHAGDASVEEVMEWMAEGGSAVLLNFGEDTSLWECSWITGGTRFTGVQEVMRASILESLNKCFASCVERDYRIKCLCDGARTATNGVCDACHLEADWA